MRYSCRLKCIVNLIYSDIIRVAYTCITWLLFTIYNSLLRGKEMICIKMFFLYFSGMNNNLANFIQLFSEYFKELTKINLINFPSIEYTFNKIPTFRIFRGGRNPLPFILLYLKPYL